MAFANRHSDKYGRLEASDAAAATASILFYWVRNQQNSQREPTFDPVLQSRDREDRMDMDYERERGRSGYAGSASSYDDPYASDERVMYGRGRGRSRSRGPYSVPSSGMGGGMPMPGGIDQYHDYHGGGSVGSYEGGGGGYPSGLPSSYSPSGGMFSNNAPVMPMGMPRTRHSSISYPMNAAPFSAGSAMGYSTGAPDPYGGVGYVPSGGYGAPGYGTPGYVSSAGGTYATGYLPGGYPASAGQAPVTVVMTQPASRSHHSHHSKHKHGKKHRSQSRHRSRSRHRG